MTPEEIEGFKVQFKRIVYKKSQIKDKSIYISSLHVWDKNGSHEDAIKKNVEQLKELKTDFKTMLQGSTYDEWLAMSRTISKIQSTIKSVKSIKAKESNEEKLKNLVFT